MIENEVNVNEPKIVKTDEGSSNGQDKCPKCGATDISTNTKTGKLRCNFCRHEFEPEKVSGLETDISKLSGEIIGSGATDIIADTKDVLTFKCSSCGAEVVIDTEHSLQARCHWCRNTLSVNEQIPNGAVPDVVLAFNVTKADAKKEIENFVGKRKFFAHPKFRQEFTTDNIMGVYFPYMLVDANTHVNYSGQGEIQKRKYYVGSGDNQETRYDADVYHVERECDLTINGLSIESNSDRLNTSDKTKTNNIINAIMPFDVENVSKYNANYLKGYTSERRDTNTNDLKPLVEVQSKDIARHSLNTTLKQYDRGVSWNKEEFNLKGMQWQSAYLPVWLYSYLEVKGDKKLLHYVAVNARTKKTMGSVPIHIPKLILVSALIEVLCIFLMFSVDWDSSWLFLLGGIIYFFVMYSRYRNKGARHTYETDTKTEILNLRKVDNFVETRKGLESQYISDVNNTRVDGKNLSNKAMGLGNKLANEFVENNALASLIKDQIDKKDGK